MITPLRIAPLRIGPLLSLASLLSFLLLFAPATAQAFEVRILRPAAGEPLLGETEVMVGISPAGTPVDRVEILLDGVTVGVAERAPYRILIDAGDENRTHRLEAVAHGPGGARATASLDAPRLAADVEIQVDLQQLFVTVNNGTKPVLDLPQGAFKVLDQDEPQPVITFGRGDVPFTAVLLVDASASMAGKPLDKALDGARAFFSSMATLDQAKLLLFSDRILLETPFTSIQSVLTLGLRGVKAEGGTALNDALYLASKRLETRRGRKIAVLISDGVDVESVLSLKEAKAIARRQVTLYWLRLPRRDADKKVLVTSAWRSAPEHQSELDLLHAAVLGSGGRIVDLTSVEEIPTQLTTLLRELREQYVLGIAPRRTGYPGAWHEVRVEVPNGLQVRTQDGYFEP
jgi:Ca-activated chloride channel family protein